MTKKELELLDFTNHIETNLAPYREGCKDVIAQLLDDVIGDDAELEEGEKVVCMNILTEEMLLYDRHYIERGSWDGYISSRYFFTAVLAKNEQDGYSLLRSSSDNDNFVNVQIKDIDYVPRQNEYSIKGNLEIITGEIETLDDASFPVIMPVSICWTDGIVSTAGNDALSVIAHGNIVNFNSSISNRIESVPEPKMSNEEGSPKGTVKIFNVGNANFVSYKQNVNVLDGTKEKTLIIDAGVGYDYDQVNKVVTRKRQYSDARDYIVKNERPELIIISHLHLDHYLYLDIINSKNLKGIIISEDVLVTKDYNINKYIASIVDKVKIYTINKVIPNARGTKRIDLSSFGFKDVYLFKGLGKVTPPVSAGLGVIKYNNGDRIVDDSGILVTIGKGLNRIIISGDCSYYSWPDEDELDLSQTCRVLVPHHGGHVIIKDLNALVPNSNLFKIVCVSTTYHTLQNLNNSLGETYHRKYIDALYHKGSTNSMDFRFTCEKTSAAKPYRAIDV